jgi:chemotaxis protein MotB
MAFANRRRSRRPSIDIWPGFVDALSQLLMVIIFVLLVFTAGQFFLSDALSGRDQALKELQQQVNDLSSLLSLERSNSTDLSKKLTGALAERESLATQLGELTTRLNQESSRAEAATGTLHDSEAAVTAEQDKTRAARAEVEALSAQLALLRDQLAKIAAALDASETKVKEQQGQIVDLGKRLNMALVNKVAELAKYRSEFFGRLREIIGERPDIRIVGDRFVFQSEVLFAPGSAELGDAAKQQLDPVITALKEISAKIPKDVNWVLRIDGHTDQRPIHNAQFASNWELSAARAISVVRYAIEQGVPSSRLAAAGFADNQPIDAGQSDDAYRRNRRIELKLTER